MGVVSVFAYVNDIEIELEQNTETEFWEATAVAPAKSSYPLDGHYYGVTLIAADEAGNETKIDATDSEFGEALRLVVKETVVPVIKINSPTEGELTSNNTPTVDFVVTDDDSGVDPDTIKVYIDGSEFTGFNAVEIDDGYSVTFVTNTLEDGQHTITVTASDNDGNAADSVGVSFKIQATASDLSISSPDDNSYFNTATITVSGTTDGASVTVQIGDNDPISVSIVDGEFSQEFELTPGENTITITAYSESGVETIITRTVIIDLSAPVFRSVSLKPNPIDAGKTYVISVEVVDELW